jgi:hypothetical protein
MALNATDQARQELAEVHRLIEECRHDLGISNGKPTRHSTKRIAGLFRRGLRDSRQARRQAPVA